MRIIIFSSMVVSIVNGQGSSLPSFAKKMLELQQHVMREVQPDIYEESIAPNYMLNLFREKEGLDLRQQSRSRFSRGGMHSFTKKQKSALKNANFIRSFQSIGNLSLKILLLLANVFDNYLIYVSKMTHRYVIRSKIWC